MRRFSATLLLSLSLSLVFAAALFPDRTLAAWEIPQQIERFSERITSPLRDAWNEAGKAFKHPFRADEKEVQAVTQAHSRDERHIEPPAYLAAAAEAVSDFFSNIRDTVRSWFAQSEESESPSIPVQPLVQESEVTSQSQDSSANSRGLTSGDGGNRPAQNVTYINQPVHTERVERIIERVVQGEAQGGVSETTLSARLQDLASTLNDRIQNAFLGAARSAIVQNVSDITVDGITGLTDADIPDGLTASSYLPLAGGTLTGTLTGTNLTLSGDLTVSGAITIPYLSATSTTASTFIQASTTRFSVFDTAYFGGTSTTTIGSAGSITLPSAALLTAPYASSTALTVTGTAYFGTASTTNLIVSSAGGTGTRCLQVGADGTVSANASACGTGSGGDSFTTTTHFGTTTSATTTPLWLRGSAFSLFASSTSVFDNASTTQLTLGSDFITSVSGDALELTAGGILNINDVTAAMLASSDFGDFTCNGTTCSFDDDTVSDAEIDYTNVTLNDFTNDAGFATFAYPFPSDATSTKLSFTGGLLSTASTTIGNGTATGGLTVSGTATSTNLRVTALTSGRVPYLTTGSQFTDSANLTFDGTTLTANTLALSTDLSVANGGTGASTFTSSQLLYGAGTGALQSVATTTLSLGTGLSYSGTLGSLVGGAAGTLSLSGVLPSSLSLTKGNFIVGDDAGTAQATSTIFISSTGNVGIGTSTPAFKLSVTNAVSTAQTSIAYDDSNATNFLTGATGDLVITPSGNDATFIDSNLFACQGTACPTTTATSTTGNLFVENAVTIGSGWSLREIDADELGLYDAGGSLMIIFDEGT